LFLVPCHLFLDFRLFDFSRPFKTFGLDPLTFNLVTLSFKIMNTKKHLFTFALAALASLGSATAQCDFACGDSLTISHVAGTIAPATVSITYGTDSYNSKCWFTRNLGATAEPLSATDDTYQAAGWYWQFNRKQGYENVGSNGSTANTPSTTWITAIDEISDWQAENDPCNLFLGNGWRIPTSTEWTDADALEAWANYNDTYTSLKLHPAGYLNYTTGALDGRGAYGNYWSSTQSSTANGYRLYFDSSSAGVDNYNKAYGFSLRCCRDL
jgi:uncharacterized protein (TIGR02145 family)